MPPLALPLDVVPRILGFLNTQERAAAGYDIDICIRLNFPPVPLRLAPAWKDQLTDLQRRRVSKHGVVTYHAEQSAVVYIDFARDDSWLLFPRLHFVMLIVPNIQLRNASSDTPVNFEWFSFYPTDPQGVSCPRQYIFHRSLPEITAQQFANSYTYTSSSGLHILRNRVVLK